ncbi:MAG: transporter substrate-binding protein, partial [Sphingomonas bacterium]|nr:transporter substrate-binding protein [Sphingomonas bacterium]
MRAFACALSLSAAYAEAAPTRVASLNLCTDELVLLLAAPGQIVSLTHLAHDRAETSLWRQARRHAANDGSLLSVAALRPNLIVTMGGSGADRARIARAIGARLLILPYPASIDDVERSVAAVAAALGRRAAGARVIATIRRHRRLAPRTATDTIFLTGGGRSLAPDGLAAAWLAVAG